MISGVMVTGAGGYLGKKICRKLLNSGYGVLAIDIDSAALPGLKEIEPSERLVSCVIDITDRDALSAELPKYSTAFQKFTGLVNCISSNGIDGQELHAEFERYDVETWRRLLDINVTGVFLAIQGFKNYLYSSGPASIVNLGSIYGSMGTDHRIYERTNRVRSRRQNNPAAYSASKGAILALSRHLAALWGPDQIRVNSVSPGGIWNSNMSPEFVADYSERVPLRSMVKAETVGEVVEFLLSDRSNDITGQDWLVGGGLSGW